MSRITLKLKLVALLDTTATPAQVRNVLVNSGLQSKAENKITALAAADPQTGMPSFDWALGVMQVHTPNKMQAYPRLIVTVDTTRTPAQLLNALDDYFPEMKTQLRALATGGTTIDGWHVHRSTGDFDEQEP